jgi:ParB-like chromosome segregation protein Spo0J
MEDGWTQPIVVFDDGSGAKPVLFDGEHRWRCSANPTIAKLNDGLVPIVRIRKTRSERIMSTIRHNRARGEHGVLNMAELVQELFEDGHAGDRLCAFLGMEDEEVRRLAERAGLREVVTRAHTDFGKGWVPG